ncbi:MAG: hypothetical protein ACXV3D_05570 [Halobacteriota archaeon]
MHSDLAAWGVRGHGTALIEAYVVAEQMSSQHGVMYAHAQAEVTSISITFN